MYLTADKWNEILDSRGADLFVSIDPRIVAAGILIGAIVAIVMFLARGKCPTTGGEKK